VGSGSSTPGGGQFICGRLLSERRAFRQRLVAIWNTYAAYALHAWLINNPVVSSRTRRFARWSAMTALLLGMVG
jgi:hypothetical protein